MPVIAQLLGPDAEVAALLALLPRALPILICRCGGDLCLRSLAVVLAQQGHSQVQEAWLAGSVDRSVSDQALAVAPLSCAFAWGLVAL